MLIILEGADGSGKSTLADRLVDLLATNLPGDTVELRHKGPPTQHPLDEYETPLWDYRPGQGKHIICDRWHLGELVYPKVLGRESLMDDVTRWHIDQFLKCRGALVIYMTAPLNELVDAVETRGDDLIKASMLLSITQTYDDVIQKCQIPSFIVKHEDADPSIILSAADSLEVSHVGLNEYTTYIGPRYPGMLLLGDQRNVSPDKLMLPSPAFMPYPSTSGHYLLKSLLSLDDARNVGIANACDVDNVNGLWAELGYPKTVALGNHASLNFPTATRHVPHPQWVRRFKYRQHQLYGQQILQGRNVQWNFG